MPAIPQSTAGDTTMLFIDPHAQVQNTTVSGTPDTLTLQLPIRKPDLAVWVIELFPITR